MKALLITLALITGNLAHADGFKCISESGLAIKVFNHTQPEDGTRTGAVMVVSDANVGFGNKTIASFKAEKGVLASKELVYTAKVDLRMSESNRQGELIGGTKLGYLSKLSLIVHFSYAAPLADGERVGATLKLTKRDGEQLFESVSCTRYLKN